MRTPKFTQAQLRYIASDAWEHSTSCSDGRDARSWRSIARKANASMKRPAFRANFPSEPKP